AARTAATDGMSEVPGARSAVVSAGEMRLSKSGRKLMRASANRPGATVPVRGSGLIVLTQLALSVMQQPALRAMGAPLGAGTPSSAATAAAPRCWRRRAQPGLPPAPPAPGP